MRKFLITVLVLFLVNFILAYFFMLGFNIVGRDSYGAIASGITGSVFGGMLVILWPYLIFYKLFTWKKFVVISLVLFANVFGWINIILPNTMEVAPKTSNFLLLWWVVITPLILLILAIFKYPEWFEIKKDNTDKKIGKTDG